MPGYDDSRHSSRPQLREASPCLGRTGADGARAAGNAQGAASPCTVVSPKLGRPSAASCVPRKRAFALLDRFRRPIMWLDGPSGADKTALVSRWIETRGLKCLWYRLDGGDADAATFFRELAQAVPAHAAQLLSTLGRGHPTDLAASARRFFKALLEITPGLEVIVFEDFHRVAEGSALPMLVRELAQSCTAPDPLRDGLPCMLSINAPSAVFAPRTGLSVVVLSQSSPPSEFSRANAFGDLTCIGWQELQPDIEEKRRLEPRNAPAAERNPDSPSRDVAGQPIRIFTLGRFDVIVNGEVLRQARKAQRRVLDLLKTLVALGAAGVSRETVAATLWPDSEGDAARDAFEVTLHRLRKLLGCDDAILLEHGMVRVNRELAWVDVVAFERLANEANGDQGPVNLEAATRALALYQGPFLHNEQDAPWLLPPRDRLRSRFIRLAARTAQQCELAGDPARAADICAAAVEVEPLAEELYRRLMACLAAQGRRAEALDAYRRCRHMLSVVLGIAPSRETEAAHAAIAQAA